MKLVRAFFVFLAMVSTATIAAQSPVKTETTGFKFPQSASPPSAPRPVDAGAVPVLAPDALYVVPHDLPFLLFDSPPGKLKVTRVVGPVTIFGKFLDKPGEDAEMRTFPQKNIAIVQVAKDPSTGKTMTGRVELIAAPDGIKEEKGAIRQLIDLGAAAPIPAPKMPPPKPTPESELQKSLAAAWALEDAGTNEQLTKLIKAFRDCAAHASKTSIISRKQLAAESNRVANLAVTSDGLNKVRRAAGDWLNKEVGQSDVALDEALRKAYVDGYNAVADALEILK